MANGAEGVFLPGQVEPVKYHQFVVTDASPIEFYPSDVKIINITIKNIFGYSAFDVSTVIDSNKANPLKFIRELQKYVANEIGPNQNFNVNYEVSIKDSTPRGTYYIPLTILWSVVKDGSVKSQEDLLVGIKVTENPEGNNIEITDIIVPEKIYSGDNFRVKVLMKNIGTEKIKSIKTSIPAELPFASKNTSNEKYVYSLEPNETTAIYFDLYVDKMAISRVYNFNLSIEYQDIFNRHVNKQSTFGILVEESTKVYIHDIIIDPPTLEPGDNGLLTMQVTNSGTNDIKNIRVAIKGGDYLLVQTENFIGQISPKKSSSLSFGIYVDPDLRIGKYGLDVQITYDDVNGNTHEYSYLYPMSIVSIPLIPISSETKLALIGGFLFIIFINIIFVVNGKRKKERKSEDKNDKK